LSRNTIGFFFTERICQQLAKPPNLEDHPLSIVRNCLFNSCTAATGCQPNCSYIYIYMYVCMCVCVCVCVFAVTLHIRGGFSIRNLRTRHDVVKGTQDRNSWQALMTAIMNLWVPLNAGNILTNSKSVSFSRRTLPCGVSI
jgi:hypothetical protein